jgi:NAD(P)-dependent dehydrogenase (short-subunit alcohol dehydrogenase family)
MSPTVFLVTGSNRGIGLEIVKQLSERSDVLIFAGVRDVKAAQSSGLGPIIASNPKKVHAIQVTSADEEDNRAAAAEVEKVAGKIDVVIANAGTGFAWVPATTVNTKDFSEHWRVNTLGSLVLFQAFYGLLKKSSGKFVYVSTSLGSNALAGSFPGTFITAYGSSKAASNFLVRQIQEEVKSDGILLFNLHREFFRDASYAKADSASYSWLGSD